MNTNSKSRNFIIRTLKSNHTGEVYNLYIKLPKSYYYCQRLYPVLYVFDAEYNFGLIDYIVKLHVKNNTFSELLIIGVVHNNSENSVRYTH